MKSVMQHNFSQVPPPQIQRSVFNRSHGWKGTFDAGQLIPFYVDEVLPGDTKSLGVTIMARLQSMFFPIMDNIFLDFFFFFVPFRILWDNWEKFNGAQTKPGDSTDFLIPHVRNYGTSVFSAAELSVGDYFGIPPGVTFSDGTTKISALPFRAYYMIWNEWFRDQNLQPEVEISTGDGPDDRYTYGADYKTVGDVMKRGKRHDYFTSALPWPQKGDSVMLPLGTWAPVVGDGHNLGLDYNGTHYGLASVAESLGEVFSAYTGNAGVTSGAANSGTRMAANTNVGWGVSTNKDYSGLRADLSLATAATVNQLRQAFAYQKVLERDARGGTRYVEHLKAHWGVTSPDFRLQRPEYLGGGSQRVNIASVPQTSGSPAAPSLSPGSTPQANLAAYGIGHGQGGFHKSFVEHGVIIGLVNVRADITYQQGLNRMWTRQTRFDFPLPALMHLGEQAILAQEIYAAGTIADDDVWGYQERWAEYRYYPSQVTSAFRSSYSGGTLHAWHLALNFGSLPALNDSFIQDNPPLDRVISVDNEPQIIMDSYISIKDARPMPVYSVPGMMDRF